MNEKIKFDYFYGKEADMLSFYRIPKLLFTNDLFKVLSTDAKVLYGLMLDRMSLSIKNKWFDEENRAYIYFSIEEIMEMLNCKKNKAIGIMKELDAETGIGLLEKRRQGQGKPSMIYVKSFIVDENESAQKFKKPTSETCEESSEVGNSNLLKLEKQTSRSPKNKPLEVGKKDPNYTYINNTDFNKSNPILSVDSDNGLDEYEAYSEIIKDNLEIDIMYERYPFDRELIEGIYDLILETVLCKSGNVIIASNEYPVQLVKSKFLKLNCMHLEYVMRCMKSNTSKVRNIKKYLLAALFNAPTTISGYYQAEVNHDMPQFAHA
ncbi:MAG: DUF6017 domain-containing protein [Lachnospiraceae bacterium]|nr:DUF6017 domain-containing protein [Lachnospiraceae bacterium]